MVYKNDQVFSPIAKAFMRAMELKSPVAVIAGEQFLTKIKYYTESSKEKRIIRL
jgi:hypothetical protein